MGSGRSSSKINLNAHRGHWLSFDKESDDDEEEDVRTLNLDDLQLLDLAQPMKSAACPRIGGVNEDTLLHRIIKPDWWLQHGAISSQAFRPGPNDRGQLIRL